MQKKLNEDFIDSYCEKFAAKVTDSFFTGEKITITGKEILKITPSKQTNLFVIKLIFQYWQGESKKLESPFFNYESAAVQEALAELMNVLSQNIEIHKNRFQLLLNNAVKDTIYLAASPQAYLEIDLDGAEVDSIDDGFVENSLRYVKIYKKDIENFLSDMRGLTPEEAIDELTDEFEPFSSTEGLEAEAELLSEVVPLKPEKILSEEFPEDFDDFDDEVFDNDDDSSDDKIKEQGKVEEEEEEEVKEEATSNELRFQAEEKATEGMIHPGWGEKQGVMPEDLKWGEESSEPAADNEGSVEEVSNTEQEPIDGFEEGFFDEVKETEEDSADELDEPSEDAPVVEESMKEEDSNTEEVVEDEQLEDEEKATAPGKMPPEEDQVANESDEEEKPEVETINDQFEAVEKTVAEHHEEEKKNSLMESISVNHQYMFVKELFKDDQVSFQNALYELEEYDSFDDAVEFLVQGYAKEFSWDMQSNEVKELLKVLFRKYRD